MKNHKDALDKKVYDSLQDMEVPYEPSNWAAMSARLDALYTEENPPATDPVDTAVHKALNSLEVGFNPSHWEIMAQRLETIKILTSRIWTAKISEVAILVLLMLNWGNLLVDTPSTPTIPKISPNIPVAAAPMEIPSESNIVIASTEAISDVAENGTEIDQIQDATASASEKLSLNEVFATSFGLEEKNTSVQESSVPQISQKVVPSSEKSDLELSALDALATNNQNQERNLFDQFDDLPILAPNGLASQHQRNISVPLPILKKKKQRYIATYAAFDRTHIATPRYFNVPPYTQNVNNVSAGVLIGSKKGKMLLETGFAYSSIQYAPKVNLSANRFGAALSNVDYDAISIPVRVGRSLGKHKKLSIKAFAGVNLTTIAQANYSYKTFPNTTPGPNPEPTPTGEIGNGLFEGGSFADNSFLNMEASLRFEHAISSKHRSKIFIEPTYQRDIFNADGTGPNRDRLSAFSLRAGVLTTL